MEKNELLIVGEECLKKEMECVKSIILAQVNQESKYINYKKYLDTCSETNKIIDEYFKKNYDLNTIDLDSRFYRLLLECQEYLDLCNLQDRNDKVDSSLISLGYSLSKVRFVINYELEQELLKAFNWFCKNKNYSIINPSLFANAFIETNNDIIAFRNYFNNNKLGIEINDSDLEIMENVAYILTTIRMNLIHYIFISSLMAFKEDSDDISILLTIYLLSIINVSKKHKIEELIIENIKEVVLDKENPFIKLKKYFSGRENILLIAFKNAQKLSKEYYQTELDSEEKCNKKI